MAGRKLLWTAKLYKISASLEFLIYFSYLCDFPEIHLISGKGRFFGEKFAFLNLHWLTLRNIVIHLVFYILHVMLGSLSPFVANWISVTKDFIPSTVCFLSPFTEPLAEFGFVPFLLKFYKTLFLLARAVIFPWNVFPTSWIVFVDALGCSRILFLCL